MGASELKAISSAPTGPYSRRTRSLPTKAREFYIGFLGFSIDWEHRFGEQFPLYRKHGDCHPGGALRIETNDIDRLNQELLQKDYKYAKPGVEQTPWKTREMSITDPFGNRFLFFERIV